jgi:Lanthionine synthetase C-like protein
MLFDPEAHEPLVETSWDEARVRAAVREIAAEAESAFDPADLWPVHPRDENYTGTDVYTTHGLWSGAAGMLWGLHRLAGVGAVELSRSYADAAASLHGDYVRRAGGETPAVPGLWCGEAGILLMAEIVAPGSGAADRLLAAVRENSRNETVELMWGSPGTMLAARAMLDRTGDERWRDAWEESAEWLWGQWRRSDELGCHLWTQHLYGHVTSYVGPGHGFAGNVIALSQLVRDERRTELGDRVATTIGRLAAREDGLANWSPQAGAPLVANETIRVQWCHGAPGIVSSLASLAPGDDELTALLVEGGELTWRAGPLRKGGGLCHGTAGNGYAFLKLFERTGDERWLERARAFAMHAIGQVERAARQHGGGRHTLWTGDPGTALFLSSCISANAAVPTLDVF